MAVFLFNLKKCVICFIDIAYLNVYSDRKIHEELRKQSLLHAMDYSNMDANQLQTSVNAAMKNDKRMTKFVKYAFKFNFNCTLIEFMREQITI